MIEQYPDILIAYIPTEGGYDPVTGDYIPVTMEEREVVCRFTPNGAGRRVEKADGEEVVYAFDLCFPEGTELPQQIDVSCSKYFEGKKEMIRFKKGQLHSRGWI